MIPYPLARLAPLALLLALTSCLTEGQRQSVSPLTQDYPEPNRVEDTASTTEKSNQPPLFWFTDHQEEGYLHLYLETLSPFFLRGTVVQSYLSDPSLFAKSYCLVAEFATPLGKKQLRIQATPQLRSPLTGHKEALFVIQLHDRSENSSMCQGTLNGTEAQKASYHPKELCQNQDCGVNALSSTSVQLWAMDSPPTLEERINLGKNRGFFFHLTGSSPKTPSSSNSSPSCTDSACRALGMDCCLPGVNQCVKDAKLRPQASSKPQFAQAQAQISHNPSLYTNWPEIYYICPQGGSGEGNQSGGGESSPATPTFQELLNAYHCQEGDLTLCLQDRQEVMGTIQVACGCPAPHTCPQLHYQAQRDKSDNIVGISCQDKSSPAQETQDHTIYLSNRSVPHRFYRGDTGKSVNNFLEFATNHQEIEQEGEPFFYLDHPGQSFPQNGAYNMNSIMGQMSLNLSSAQPAVAVPVEQSRVYIISGIAGSSLPCPLCPRDQWLEEFSAHPSLTGVNGLIATGYGTRRDFFGQNNTRGNYEDTKFGRACWVPPTMIPFSHKAHARPSTQRQNRLTTQAALYLNGYQRDWFGFNKGALIGSFDGVRWFAIGTARRIQAKSHQLFLALNAPFGDLAGTQTLEVTVSEDISSKSQVPNYDFDPSLKDPRHAHYNRAASCQQYHQCQVDADCVSQLGWEYQCADVSPWKTLSPLFDIMGEERGDTDRALSSSTYPVGGGAPNGTAQTKRCVYRGRGALCQQDFSTLSEQMKKLFTCAPNFYCANLGAKSFNHQLVRTPQLVNNILYGFEADILGRPMDYLGGQSSLPNTVQNNIQESFTKALKLSGTAGICLPGKDISEDTHLEQHKSRDTATRPRTDYINQIGSCHSTIEDGDDIKRSERVWGCPLFDQEGNYLLTTDASSLTQHRHKFLTQNSCGYSSQDATGIANTFAPIEAQALGTLSSLVRKSHSEHACLRRGGSPCFTDLDCTPSRLHSEWAEFLGWEHFGDTQGEKTYWQEYLVCAQGKREPLLGSDQHSLEEGDRYDLTQNRCCRSQGQTMSFPNRRDLLLTGQVVRDDPSRPIGDRLPSMDRSRTRRSSRYMAIYEDLDLHGGPTPTPYRHFLPILPANGNTCGTGCRDGEYQDVTADLQWKAPHDLANKTCCGGGWVRKFADGTHDWTKTDRLFLSPENFQCLNYTNNYIFSPPPGVSRAGYNKDLDKICREAKNQGCPQVNWKDSPSLTINSVPTVNAQEGQGLIDSHGILVAQADYSSLSSTGEDLQKLSTKGSGVFAPTSLRHRPSSGNPNQPWLSFSIQEVEYFLPSSINVMDSSTENNLISVGVSYSPRPETTDFADFTYTGAIWTRSMGMGVSPESSLLPGGMKFKVQVNYDRGNNHWIKITCINCQSQNFTRAFPVIEFIPMGTRDYREKAGEPTVGQIASAGGYSLPHTSTNSTYGMQPGSDLYYLTKLGRLELLGIPEINYEPLYCNTQMNQLLPGLYHRLSTREEVEDSNASDDYFSIIDPDIISLPLSGSASADEWVVGHDNPGRFVLPQEEMNFRPIFHETQVVCCSPLGTKVSHEKQCCTNHTRKNPLEDSQSCALPSKTNLMVYFNRFVSGEGRYHEDTQPEGLIDDDFNPKSGEPKLRESTYDKIKNLGDQYCDNQEDVKTRTGGAVGSFLVEPLPPGGNVLGNPNLGANDPSLRRYGIVDSLYDSSIDKNRETGYWPFVEGFRWNHHLYCK